jgi:hypothetical protein
MYFQYPLSILFIDFLRLFLQPNSTLKDILYIPTHCIQTVCQVSRLYKFHLSIAITAYQNYNFLSLQQSPPVRESNLSLNLFFHDFLSFEKALTFTNLGSFPPFPAVSQEQ